MSTVPPMRGAVGVRLYEFWEYEPSTLATMTTRPSRTTHQERNATMRRRGFTILELLILLAVLAIVFAIAALDVRPLHNEARSAANEVASAVRLTRGRAMATTSAHRLGWPALPCCVWRPPSRATTLPA